jgi:hypothetical protein
MWALTTWVGAKTAALPVPTLEDGAAVTPRQRIVIGKSALPDQIVILPMRDELPLSLRTQKDPKLSDAAAAAIGRGPQLRAPMRLVATVGGTQTPLAVVKAAEPAADADGVAAQATLEHGGLEVVADVRVTARGVAISLSYKGDTVVDALHLELPLAGGADLVYAGNREEEPRNPLWFRPLPTPGVAWSNAPQFSKEHALGIPSGALAFVHVGTGDRGFLLMSRPEHWALPKGAETMALVRDDSGSLTWRIQVPGAAPRGEEAVSLAISVSPTHVKPVDARPSNWLRELAAEPGSWPHEVRVRPTPTSVLLAPVTDLPHPTRIAGADGDATADLAGTWPMPPFRLLAGAHLSRPTVLQSNSGDLTSPGRRRAPDRVVLGRALIHDIGVDATTLAHRVEALRVVEALHDFGALSGDGMTEFIPYWRSGAVCRYGEPFDQGAAFEEAEVDPMARVYVSAFIRPAGKNGRMRKALFVVLNESDQPVREQFYVLNPKLAFGRGNALTADAIVMGYDFSKIPDNSDWTKYAVRGFGRKKERALRNAETGGVVLQAAAKRQQEAYGPSVYVGAHDFVILYGSGE